MREAELVMGAQHTEFCLSGIHSDPQKEQASIIMGSFQIRCKEAGSRKQEAENRKQEAENRKQEAGSRRQKTGSRKQEAFMLLKDSLLTM